MYTTPDDAPLAYTFKQATAYAENLTPRNISAMMTGACRRKANSIWLFNNRAEIGGFNATGSDPSGWYRSSTEGNDTYAWAQRFRDGGQGWHGKSNDSCLRCVR